MEQGAEMITKENMEKIDSYFFIIQTLAKACGDEYSDAIAQVCHDAMSYTWKLEKEDEE